MIKVMFICHGNICRSPMAEFVFKDMVTKKGLEDMFYIASSATSTEEIGNPVHHGTRKKLKEYGIETTGKRAVQLKKEDYNQYDYLIGMEQRNITNIIRIINKDENNKVKRLLDFTSNPRDIDDPWYTGNFTKTYEDVYEGCLSLLNYIVNTSLNI